MQYLYNRIFSLSVKCYDQECEKGDPNWSCFEKGDGAETICHKICQEINHGYKIFRGCTWTLTEEEIQMIESKEEYCRTDEKGDKYCYCTQPLCNNKEKLPENIEVVE